MKKLFLFFTSCILYCSVQAQIITTIAGGGTSGLGDGGPANNCELLQPYSTAVDASGSVYIADAGNNRIRKIDATGIITTVAGTGVGGYNGDNVQATSAQLYGPVSLAFDGVGNMYISDDYNNRIRRVSPSGIISTVAGIGTNGHAGDGGAATAAQLYRPHGIALDGTGALYVADLGNGTVRKISNSGIITTIAGINGALGNTGDNGPATAAKLYGPDGLALDISGNILIGDISANCVRKVSNSGIITTVAGTDVGGYNGDGGIAAATKLLAPVGVATDNQGNIFIADGNNYIRRVNTAGIINIIAGYGSGGFSGDGGPATLAELSGPTGVTADSHGDIYIADFGNNRVRYIRNTVSVPTINASKPELHVYPNPSHGAFTVQWSSPESAAAQVIITSLLGEKVKELTIGANKDVEIQLNAVPGVYFINCMADGVRESVKVVISP
jgi:trimeric autotransporter adhesin